MLTPTVLIYGKNKKVLAEYQGSYKADLMDDFITNFYNTNGFGSSLGVSSDYFSTDYYEPYKSTEKELESLNNFFNDIPVPKVVNTSISNVPDNMPAEIEIEKLFGQNYTSPPNTFSTKGYNDS